jgi:hypothetical protein
MAGFTPANDGSRRTICPIRVVRERSLSVSDRPGAAIRAQRQITLKQTPEMFARPDMTTNKHQQS